MERQTRVVPRWRRAHPSTILSPPTVKAVGKGMLKVMAKMGISTLQSYKGAQIFEAVGLAAMWSTRCFVGTASRVQGAGFDVLADEMQRRHRNWLPPGDAVSLPVLPNPGDFTGDAVARNICGTPTRWHRCKRQVRTNSEDAYWKFADHVNGENARASNLRGLLELKPGANGGPIDLSEVESEKDIVKRFATGAMSFGSISREAHESLAISHEPNRR